METLFEDLIAISLRRLSTSQRAMVAARLTRASTMLRQCRVVYRALEIDAKAGGKRNNRARIR
jgi:hypothetical protein